MTRKRIIGKCALCGQRCALTYEHIPPRMAFNSASVRQVVGFELLKDSERAPWDMDACFYVEQKVPLLYFPLKQGCVPFFLSIFFEPPPYLSRRKTGFGSVFIHFHQKRHTCFYVE